MVAPILVAGIKGCACNHLGYPLDELVTDVPAGHSWITPFCAVSFIASNRRIKFSIFAVDHILSRADTLDDYTRILLSPQRELAPPSSRHARAGRMNSEGVSILYGLLMSHLFGRDAVFIGGTSWSGALRHQKALQIWISVGSIKPMGRKTIELFSTRLEKQVARRKFRRSLHRLISQPVVAGHENDYLITQVLAEYLAHVRKQNFDGMVFTSTQREGGTNVVLFPKHSGEEGKILARFALKYVEDSAGLYRTRKIEYDILKLAFFA